MNDLIRIGMDTSKSVFQLHGVAKLAAVALANKIARIAWKLMVTGESYRAPTSVSVAACAI
jgi:hypothetical protein